MKPFVCCLLAASFLLLSGCGGAPVETTQPSQPASLPATEATTQPPTEAPTEEPTEPPADYNPLTGEALNEVATQRIMGVMISNAELALPQCGVGQADIIYEILAEGSTTRFLGLFSDVSQAGPIGPIRSLRPYFLHIMRGYDALCTSAGGSQEADNLVYNLGYPRMNGIAGSGQWYFYRDDWRKANRGYEHSMFITGENLLAGASDVGYRTERQEDADYVLTFTHEAMTQGSNAAEIHIRFRENGKSTVLTYEAAGYYTAFQQGQTFLDGNTGETVPFRNVFVLLTETWVQDGEGHLGVVTTGEGSGYYARDGKMIPITWSREDAESPYQYFDAEGKPLELAVGKSYIAIVPENDYGLYLS